MNRVRLRKLLIGLFLGSFVLLLGLFNASKPRILVLHSTGADSQWSRAMNDGMKSILDRNRNPLSVKHHYLGVTEGPEGDRDSAQRAVNEALRAIDQQRPDLLIAVDDRSNDLVARRFAGKTGMRIVYVAILQPPEKYGYVGAENVSGVAERLPLDAVRKAILAARDARPARVAALAMEDYDGQAELAQVRAYDWAPHRLVAAQAGNSFAAWRSFATAMADQADVLLLFSYGGLQRGDGDAEKVPRQEVAAWMERNCRPLPLGVCSSYYEDGGAFSITPAPYDFGRRAMRMALAWIEAPRDSAPPAPTYSPHFKVGLRESLLAKRGIALSPLYVEAARLGSAYSP